MGDNLESVPTVIAPASKSEFHRALIMAALTQSDCKIFGYSNCADVKETIGALTALGVKISKIDGSLAVDGSEIKKIKPLSSISPKAHLLLGFASRFGRSRPFGQNFCRQKALCQI